MTHQQVTITDVCASEPVTTINAFTVPPEESERFLQRWKDIAKAMGSQPGFIQARMYKSLTNDAERRFVNVAEWDSEKALDQAMANPESRASMQRMLNDSELHVTAQPAVYHVAVNVQPSAAL
jgi:heme-degrading monooxygenase HmoA